MRLTAEHLVDLAAIDEESDDKPQEALLDDVWPDSLITRCHEESPPAMRRFLEYLAMNEEKTVASSEIAAAIDRTPPQLAGTLGAFGRRTSNRYGRDTWPFDAQWSGEAGGMLYRMTSHVAAVVSSARSATD